MQINLLFDSLAQAAPQYFKDALQKAASLLGATFTNNISVNVEIGYGEYPGNNQPESSGSASAAPSTGVYDSYNYARSYLANNAASEVSSGVSALPQSSTIQGQSQVAVWRAQEKLMGQVSAYDTGLDGYAGFATDIPEASLEGVAIHELTHAMGRVNYGPQPDVLDLYRFSSPGTRLFAGGSPNSASYFSLDGGRTDLADYGQSSDPSDFLNSSGKTPNDPFNEYYNGSTIQGLTSIDNLEMEALGYTTHANFLVTDATTGISSQSAGGTYVGPVSGISTEYISVTSDNLAVAAQVPDVFIHTGAGNDAIQVLSGRNVIDGGGGSNFMVAGTGQDTFFVDDRNATSDIWSTVVGAHSGDDVTVFGITQADFTINFVDGQGASGATGLTMHATSPGKPTASFTLAGYTKADMQAGRIFVAFGANGNEPYMNVRLS